MRKIIALIPLGLLAALPLAASQSSPPPVCSVSAARELVGIYPEHPLSPKESLRTFDSVFFAEVVVPTRRCSLGYCAGLRLIAKVKGQVNETVLVRIPPPDLDKDAGCTPRLFSSKGQSWVVFANRGTSRSGQKYLDASLDGPSFAAAKAPDFNRLEGQYRNLQAQLEQAISGRLDKRR